MPMSLISDFVCVFFCFSGFLATVYYFITSSFLILESQTLSARSDH